MSGTGEKKMVSVKFLDRIGSRDYSFIYSVETIADLQASIDRALGNIQKRNKYTEFVLYDTKKSEKTTKYEASSLSEDIAIEITTEEILIKTKGLNASGSSSPNSKEVQTGSVNLAPISINARFPMSSETKEKMPPFSFVNSKYAPQIKAMSPCYLPAKFLLSDKQRTRDEVMTKFILKPNGELKVNDPEMVAKSKGLLPTILAKVFEAVRTGRGVYGVSIPISFMIPESFTTSTAKNCGMFPRYFSMAAKRTDPLERMKDVITGIIAGFHLTLSTGKPFNPFLGETVQGIFPDGSKIYAEQVCHYPPITNILLVNDNWRFHGNFEFAGQFGGNNMTMAFLGSQKIEFKDGQKITCYTPSWKVDGLVLGERRMHFSGTFRFIDKEHGFKAVVSLGDKSDKKKDTLAGKIYKNDSKKEQLSKKPKGISNVQDQAKLDKTFPDVEKVLSNISGSIYDKVEIDGVPTWVANQIVPLNMNPVENPLPSDYRFREDFLFMMHNNEKMAEEWKFHLEETQRNDHKNRQANVKK